MKITTFLTFVGNQCGKAEEAVKFYTNVFPNGIIKRLDKYSVGEEGGTPDLIKHGEFTINGIDFMVSESNYNHAWSFTPAVSMLISDKSDNVVESIFEKLSSNGGQIMVPLDSYEGEGDYGFGKKFGWCQDKFGVSWQFVVTR